MVLKRIVKLNFQNENLTAFFQIFKENCEAIRHFPGCLHLELWQDQTDKNTIFTYSHWVNDNALQAYRQSVLFKEIWAQTKPLFAERPQAWSINTIASL